MNADLSSHDHFTHSFLLGYNIPDLQISIPQGLYIYLSLVQCVYHTDRHIVAVFILKQPIIIKLLSINKRLAYNH